MDNGNNRYWKHLTLQDHQLTEALELDQRYLETADVKTEVL